MTSAPSGVDNHAAAFPAKRDLRAWAMGEVGEAHVFDAFCGESGAMYDAVWHRAASYVGCDFKIEWPDRRRRFVGDSLRVMRAIDLSPFNVFDLDAYGDPWKHMLVLADRRAWAPGEVGAVALTEGVDRRIRMCGPVGWDELIGRRVRASASNLTEQYARQAVRAWADRAGVEIVEWRRAKRRAASNVFYSAITFRGTGGAGPSPS